ncbi:MAG: tyrosine-type recombinase/integrase [Sphingomonadales bacterium]|nr:tyrosine-type recombinase/integrase [Sphingomonadales bacterium]MDE2171990.1 tyrosine-type recombinase/integrase [Sphingomonadales bacterium]
MGHSDLDPAVHERRPWNAGQNVGPKRPLRPQDIWAIGFYLDEHKRLRDRALFDLAIDSKLRGCDLVNLRIGDLVSGGTIRNRATVIQQKTGRPVQVEIMTEARKSLLAWLERRKGSLNDFVFLSRIDYMGHISTRQYARLLDEWVSTIGLDKREYGTHSMRRTKASLIYKATGNLRAIQILLGMATYYQ